MERRSTKNLVMAGLCIALSQVLSYVKVFEMPQGGSITAGSMVPIILFSLVYGFKDGFLAAIDYLLGFGVLGLAGIFGGKKNLTSALLGTFVACILRFVMLFLSGVLVWASYTPPGMAPWYYSLTYNGTYMIPETILTLVIVALIYSKVYDSMK